MWYRGESGNAWYDLVNVALNHDHLKAQEPTTTGLEGDLERGCEKKEAVP